MNFYIKKKLRFPILSISPLNGSMRWKTKLKLLLQLMKKIGNILLNIILIPSLGAVGAAISSVVAESLILFITAYYVYTYTPVRLLKIGDFSKSILCSLSLIPIFYILSNVITGWALIFAYFIIGTVVYTLLQLFMGNSSVKILEQIIKSKIIK